MSLLSASTRAGETAPPARRATPRRPRRRFGRRVARATGRTVLLLAALGAVAAAGFVFVVPSAADADARVARLAAHRAAPVSTAAIPPRIAAALTATEDARFTSNAGIDPAGVARWARGVATGSSGDTGGATIEQQLAKMLYTDGHRQPVDQLEQVALAVKLNADYSKPELLRMYLDTAYFGHGYYGITAAAHGYFHRSPARLDWQQAALVAGLVQAPTAYDPLRHRSLARARRAHVLTRLAATGHITASQAAHLNRSPLGLR